MSWGRERAFDDMSRVLKCSRIVIVMMTRWRAAVDEEWQKLRAINAWLEDTALEYDSVRTEALLRQFVEPLMEQGVDTLVLGCTHYPFLRDTLQRIVGDDVALIDPAVAVATELTRRLGDNRRLNKKSIGTTRFFTTGNVAHVQYVASHLWGDAAIVEAMP